MDVDDCCNAAKFLAQEGKADEQRLCISGGSAGGYTTLACLAFKCAAFSHWQHTACPTMLARAVLLQRKPLSKWSVKLACPLVVHG